MDFCDAGSQQMRIRRIEVSAVFVVLEQKIILIIWGRCDIYISSACRDKLRLKVALAPRKARSTTPRTLLH